MWNAQKIKEAQSGRTGLESFEDKVPEVPAHVQLLVGCLSCRIHSGNQVNDGTDRTGRLSFQKKAACLVVD